MAAERDLDHTHTYITHGLMPSAGPPPLDRISCNRRSVYPYFTRAMWR